MILRIGTRGSDLALTQTRTVCSLLKQHHPHIDFEEVIIRTHGDTHATQSVTDDDWPIGGFVGAIEHALLAGEIDLAVHSMKDLPTQETEGLTIGAVPMRGPIHDVLVTREHVDLTHLPAGIRIGTNSPRRAAQIKQFGNVEVVPIRGNVPTRLNKVDTGEYDGVILAAAGLHRLMLRPAHAVNLPLDRCLPAPGQGALAVQMRIDDDRHSLVFAINHEETDGAVSAERCLIREIGATCTTPLGALATIENEVITLQAQLFDRTGRHQMCDSARGADPDELSIQLAARLVAGLNNTVGQGR